MLQNTAIPKISTPPQLTIVSRKSESHLLNYSQEIVGQVKTQIEVFNEVMAMIWLFISTKIEMNDRFIFKPDS